MHGVAWNHHIARDAKWKEEMLADLVVWGSFDAFRTRKYLTGRKILMIR